MLQNFISYIVSTFFHSEFHSFDEEWSAVLENVCPDIRRSCSSEAKKRIKNRYTLNRQEKKMTFLLYEQPYFHWLHLYKHRKGLRSYSLLI